jgi:hypothetical protein
MKGISNFCTDAIVLLLLFNVVQCRKKAAAHHLRREEGNSGRRFHCQNDFLRLSTGWREEIFSGKLWASSVVGVRI